jgi:CBS domain-containing protein
MAGDRRGIAVRDSTNPEGRRYRMTTAREIMSPDATCVGEKETLADAARKMADLNVGSLPICGEDNRLKGMLTDRDIVVKAIAQGRDPASVTAGELAEGKPVTIGADDDTVEILRTLAQYKVRRLPVIDGHQLVGIVALADVARALPDRPVGDVLDAISS